MDIKTITGIAVVSISDGERLGAVDDILFDLDQRRVRAFVVGNGRIIGGASRILDMADVQSIGADAVMIASRDQLKADRNDSRYQTFPNIRAVKSLRAVSQGGDVVGNLSTIRIEPSAGSFTDIEVSRFGLFSMFRPNIVIPANLVVSFGRDVAVIPDRFAHAPHKPGENPASEDQTEHIESPSAGQ